MPSSILKRTRSDEREPRRPKKKIRKSKKQLEYHSSSDEAEDDEPKDFKAINLQDSDDENILAINTAKNTFIGADSDNEASDSDVEKETAEDSDATGASSDSDASGTASMNGTKKRKRNDPEVFATSMSKILGTKLTTTKRSDPVLSRSAAATSISKEVSESRLEARARQKLRLERKHALDKGRVKDVLGLGDEERSTQGIMETEKRLKKTAQRGVIKLFNAVREAQKRGEEAKREALREGVVGMDRREEKVSEMSKKGFLELIASGGDRKVGA